MNRGPALLDKLILPQMDGAKNILWRSPLIDDQFAEYRDGDFLRLLNLSRLTLHLKSFWPPRGPQWDALALTDKGDVLLIEAKAYIGELRSPASAASNTSLEMIKKALHETAVACGAPVETTWHAEFYQLANRLAHLHLLRAHGVPAWLVLINFVGNGDMGGPATSAEWELAYATAYKTLGIAPTAQLLQHVLHIYPDVRLLA